MQPVGFMDDKVACGQMSHDEDFQITPRPWNGAPWWKGSCGWGVVVCGRDWVWPAKTRDSMSKVDIMGKGTMELSGGVLRLRWKPGAYIGSA